MSKLKQDKPGLPRAKKVLAAEIMTGAFIAFLLIPLEMVTRGRYLAAGIVAVGFLLTAICAYQYVVTPE